MQMAQAEQQLVARYRAQEQGEIGVKDFSIRAPLPRVGSGPGRLADSKLLVP